MFTQMQLNPPFNQVHDLTYKGQLQNPNQPFGQACNPFYPNHQQKNTHMREFLFGGGGGGKKKNKKK